MMSRIAVFASGRGSNLASLHAHLERSGGAEIVLVASDRPGSGRRAGGRGRGPPPPHHTGGAGAAGGARG
ncbi:MAG: hypothetical protein ACT4PJ_09695, partial [Gemmatimonadaceae bacterium]